MGSVRSSIPSVCAKPYRAAVVGINCQIPRAFLGEHRGGRAPFYAPYRARDGTVGGATAAPCLADQPIASFLPTSFTNRNLCGGAPLSPDLALAPNLTDAHSSSSDFRTHCRAAALPLLLYRLLGRYLHQLTEEADFAVAPTKRRASLDF